MTQRRNGGLDRSILWLLLSLYPRRFRDDFGDELLALYASRQRAARRGAWQALRRVACALSNYLDTLIGAPLAWRDEWRRPGFGVERHGENSMKNLAHEARSTARVLFLRQRSFTGLCVLTLAFGLGAASAIFSVVHGVLLTPLPYGAPERIVLLYENHPGEGWGYFTGPNFTELRDRLRSFEVLAGYNDYRSEGTDLTSGDQVERLRILRVGSGYFEALGALPLVGRTFRPEEEIPPGASERDPTAYAMVTEPSSPVVILSHDFWQRRFGGDRDIVGTQLELDEKPYTVVGVMPADLGGHVGGAPDLWAPLDLAPGGQNILSNNYLSVVARLAPGVTLATAQAELAQATVRLREAFPRANESVNLYAAPLTDVVVGPSRSMLGLLFAAVGAMLAIACINVANLFMARGLGRGRELGLRVALGAGRSRLFVAALVESLWIGLVGGLLGLGVAWLAVRWLHQVRPAALPRYDALGLHLPVFAFSAAAVLLTVLVFGLFPALRAAQADVRAAFGDRGGVSAGGRRARLLRDLGVSLQVAFSLMLLTAGGLLARSFATLYETDMGFDPKGALTFQLRLPDYAYGDPERRITFYDELFARLDQVPSLAASGATSKLPGNGHRNHWGFGIEGYERAEGEGFPGAEIRCVAGDILDALAIPLLAGRSLGPDDRAQSARAVLVNQALVDRYLKGREPLGVRVQVGGPPARTIVGVVADARHDPRESAVPKIYVPQSQFADSRNWDLTFAVARAPGSDATWSAVRSQVAAVIAEIDRRLVTFDVRPLAEVVAEPIARQRFSAQLMSVFAVLSLLLATVGLFGALAYSLSQRRAEIGVRMALGADRSKVLGSVLLQGLRVFALGTAVGLVGVLVMGRWVESLLYEVRPYDPRSLVVAVAILLLATAVAAIEPARRASRLDPARILRES
ncbi:MAG: ABC transporter permease [Acidobacteriota bacterium]